MTIVNDKRARPMNPPLHSDRTMEAMMIRNVMVRLDGPRTDDARLATGAAAEAG